MALEKFSRYQKVILIVIAAALVLPMGIMGIARSVMSEPPGTAGVLFGQKITETDLGLFAKRWRSFAGVNVLVARGIGLDRPDALLDYFIMTKVAEKAGIRVGDDDVSSAALALLGLEGDVKREAYEQQAVARSGLPVNLFEETIREFLMCRTLRFVLIQSTKITQAELRGFFDENLSEVKLELATLQADLFRQDVAEPTEEEVRARYERDKENPALMIPRRVRVEYLAASYETWMPLVKVEEKDLLAHYERKKAEYLVEEPLASQPTTSEGASSPEGSSDAADGSPASQASAVDEEVAPAEETPAPSPPRYRLFEEVRQEIERKIRRRRAEDEVAALILKARREVQELGMSVAAERNGLVQGETGFFSAQEAAEVDVIGGELAAFGADDYSLGFVVAGMGAGDVSTSGNAGGEYVIRVLDEQPPRAPSFEEAREKVTETILSERTFEATLEAARGGLEAARGGMPLGEAISLLEKGIEVSTTEFLGITSFEPYAREAIGARVGDCGITIGRGPGEAIYIWKAIERKLPEEELYQNFRGIFGNAQFIESRYRAFEQQWVMDMKRFAGWRDLRKKEKSAVEDEASDDDRP